MTTPARRGGAHRRNLRRRAQVDIPASVDTASRRVLQAWERAFNLIARDLERDALAAAERGPLSRADFRTGRLGAALDQAERQFRDAAQQSSAIVTRAAGPIARGSVEVQESYLFGRVGDAGINVNRLDPARLRRVVERTTEQIASRYIVLSRDAERALRDQLVTGVARGAGPRDVARRIVADTQGVFGGGAARSLNLARTELVDLSRRASSETYAANPGLVTGWRWSAALDTRTCPACWAMHNTAHAPEEVLEGHQQCRCVPVPILSLDDDDDDLGDPAAAFARLPRDQQLAVMGPARLQALDDGLPFSDLVQRRDNPGWRPGHYARPVRDLGTPRVDAPNPLTRVPVPARPDVTPAPAPEVLEAVAFARTRAADALALESDTLDPTDLDTLREELQAARTSAWLRAVDETGEDLDLDPWLEDVLDDGRLEPAARRWVGAHPQPSLDEYAAAVRRRADALTPDLPPVPAEAADEWADAWGGVEAALPRRLRAPDLDAEYEVYRHALYLEAVEATGGALVKRTASPADLARVETWLMKGGRMPSLKVMSEELQQHLGVGEFGTSRSTPFLSKTEWRRQRDRRPDDLDDGADAAADVVDEPLPGLPPAVQAAQSRARSTPGRYLDDDDPDAAEDLLRATYTVDLPGGYASRVDRLTGTRVRGVIVAPDGTTVGKFERTLERDRRSGDLRVRHDSLKIDEAHQGRGLASAFNAHAEGFYREKGVRAITTYASSDGQGMVGGYVWARAGFDWADPEDVALFARLLRDRPYGGPEAEALADRMSGDREGWPTPFDLSETEAGRRLLLNEPWEAIRWLT